MAIHWIPVAEVVFGLFILFIFLFTFYRIYKAVKELDNDDIEDWAGQALWTMKDLISGKWYRATCATKIVACQEDSDCMTGCREGSRAQCRHNRCYVPPNDLGAGGSEHGCGEHCLPLIFANTQSNTTISGCLSTQIHLKDNCKKVRSDWLCRMGSLFLDGRCAPIIGHSVVYYKTVGGDSLPLTIPNHYRERLLQFNPNIS